MPDYLSDCATPYGVVDRATHDDGASDADEAAWLESRPRCFLELPALEAVGTQKPTRYRLPTYWWVAALETAVRQRCPFGSEAFPSPDTWQEVRKILGKAS